MANMQQNQTTNTNEASLYVFIILLYVKSFVDAT